MARRNIPFLPNHYYHVYNRGAHKVDIFRNDADYVMLLNLLKEKIGEFDVSGEHSRCVESYSNWRARD